MPKTFSEFVDAGRRIALHGPTMGTRWSVTVDGPLAADMEPLSAALAAAVRRVDEQMSPWKADSDLTRLNRATTGAWVDLPEEIVTVLARALEIARLSDGAFDPTVGALVEAWGFGKSRDVPDAAAIRAARSAPATTHACVDLDVPARRARKEAAVQLDLCGIAKGYAVDLMTTVLREHGVRNALVALDGELRALGPQADGAAWPVAVESPEPGRRAAHGVIELQDLAVGTSGDYRRFLRLGDARVAHSMDARRAAPVNNAVASVTVLAPDCMDADAWATALLVAGPDDGMALARRQGLEALFLLRHDGGWTERGLGRFADGEGRVDAGSPVNGTFSADPRAWEYYFSDCEGLRQVTGATRQDA
ncbi:MAG: FAD:protein FMN transferase [Burkholderiales bacterium]